MRYLPAATGMLAFSLAACAKSPESPAPKSGSSAETPPPSALEGPLALGTTLPSAEVSMKNVDGTLMTLSEAAGTKGTLVIFTCNHCPYAKAWEGRIAAIGNEYLAKEIGVIAINPNDPKVAAEDSFEGMKARASKLGLAFPYVVDETSGVARAYGATKTPEVYLFDAKRRLVYHGAVDDNSKNPEGVEDDYLRDALTALLEGRRIEQPETRAIGCSIKFRPPTS